MALNPSSVPLLEFLRNTARLQFLPALSKQIQINVTPHNEHEDICVNIDPVKLGLVFGNLLSNAVKFTPPHGRIDITMTVDTSPDAGKNKEHVHTPLLRETYLPSTSTEVSHLVTAESC